MLLQLLRELYSETPAAPAGDEVLDTQGMINRIMELRGLNGVAPPSGQDPETEVPTLSDNERFQVEQQTRNFMMDTERVFDKSLPDATDGQRQKFVTSVVRGDVAEIIASILAARKTSEEKESSATETAVEDLHVEGPTSGAVAPKGERPKTLRGGIQQSINDIFGGK